MASTRALVVLALALAATGTVCRSALADLAVWSVVSGNWNVGSNWDTGVVPGNEATAPKIGIIDNAGVATIDSAVATIDEVWVGDSGGDEIGGPGTLEVLPGGALTVINRSETEGGVFVGRTVDQFGEHSGSRMNVSGGSVVADSITVGQTTDIFSSTDAQLTISGEGSVTVTNWMRVGASDSGATGGAEGILTVRDNGVFTHDGSGTFNFPQDFIAFGFNGGQGGASGTLNLEDNALFMSARPVRFGWVEEGKGFLNVSGDAQLLIDSGEMSPAAIMFGDFNNSPIGTGDNRPIGIATQTGGTVSVGTDAARPQWTAIGGSGRGEYYLSGGTLNIWVRDGLNIGDTDQNNFAGEGLFEMTGGTLNATEVTVGKIGRSTGTFNQSGGTVNIGIETPDGNFVDRVDTMGNQAELDPNYDGKLNLGGGFGAGSTAAGEYNLSDGTLHAMGINVGFLADGTFTQTGGTATADVGVIVAFGTNDEGRQSVGVLNLDGGVFETAAIGGGGGGVSTVNFNGGTVRATVDQAEFIVNLSTANVDAGGLIVDSNGFDVAASQEFSGVGGLTKQGDGALTLTGASTYGGGTTVEAGTLLVNGTHTGGGAYTVDAGAVLGGTGEVGADVTVNGSAAPGESIGTLSVNGDVAFGDGGVFDVEVDAAGGVSDLLAVNGDLDLSGVGDMLRLSLFAGSLPEAGPLTIATYTGALTGEFDLDNAELTIDYGAGVNSAITISDITSIDSGGGPAGDYNNDGVVDGRDYVLWRDTLGASVPPGTGADGSGNGTIDAADYNVWQGNYGATQAGSAGAAPEPAAALLAIVAGAGLLLRRGARRRSVADVDKSH